LAEPSTLAVTNWKVVVRLLLGVVTVTLPTWLKSLGPQAVALLVVQLLRLHVVHLRLLTVQRRNVVLVQTHVGILGGLNLPVLRQTLVVVMLLLL
jgi:hypothetical protein